VGLPRGLLPHDLIALVDLKAALLKVLDHPLGEHLVGIIGHVILQEPAQEIAAACDREADREDELVAEWAVIHRRRFVLVSFSDGM
jgi:hypothetical protein